LLAAIGLALAGVAGSAYATMPVGVPDATVAAGFSVTLLSKCSISSWRDRLDPPPLGAVPPFFGVRYQGMTRARVRDGRTK
jgi:hypothetical protein